MNDAHKTNYEGLESLLIFSGTLSLILNYLLHEQLLNSLVFAVQVVLVIGCILSKRYYHGLAFHLIFLTTAITIPLNQFTNPGESSFGLYNYPKLKLIGPLAVTQFISFLFIFLYFFKSKRLILSKDFKVLFSFLFLLLVLGNVSALIFYLLVYELSLKSYMYYSVYICSGIIYLFLAAIILQSSLKHIFVNVFIKLILISPIVAAVYYLLGMSMAYGNEQVAIATELIYFWPFVFFSNFVKKKRLFSVFSLLAFLVVFVTGAMGGKGFIMLLITALVIAFFYKRILIQFIIFSVLIVLLFNILGKEILYEHEGLKLFVYKLESAFLLIYGLISANGLDIIPASPRIRIYEVMLTYESWKENWIFMVIGSGYGGHFSDLIDLFDGLNLQHSYPEAEIQSNKFTRPHDTFPSVLFLHGLLGVCLFTAVASYFFIRAKSNKLYLSFIPFIILAFYYNHQFALVGVILLLCASVKIERKI